MLSKLEHFLRRYEMVQPGDSVVCAVSGGADSIALLFALYLLREKLQITVSAAHFNHRLRGEESDRDEAFVRKFCANFGIALQVGSKQVEAGKKGLEAAARDARYAFFETLPGKIATAHTADDNAETVLMHMIRGTGLKGLGGITPVYGYLIRPMLGVTRQEIIAFLQEYHLDWVTDSSNDTDRFLRNRLRHHIVPLLERENPRFAENLSAMALRLRQDEQVLSNLAGGVEPSVSALGRLEPAVRSRAVSAMLQKWGVTEPESEHIAAVENLLYSNKPSASVCLPGGVIIARNYDRLELRAQSVAIETVELRCPGETEFPELGIRVICSQATECINSTDCFTVIPQGKLILRSRRAGDAMRLPGGTRELKKVFIDRKIPAVRRLQIPVAADDAGVLGVFGVGVNMDRVAKQIPAVQIRFESL